MLEISRVKARAPGAALALSAALGFAISVPAGKLILRGASPLAVAALFYLGAGITLTIWRGYAALRQPPPERASRPRGGHPVGRNWRDWGWLMSATLAGAVAAPVLLFWGLDRTPGSTAALLLSFETVFTALWAAVLFREHVARLVWGAVAAVTAGALILGLGEGGGWGISLGALGVAGGCALWGLDNNLTRNIESFEPGRVAQVKGLGAGTFNLLLLGASGGQLPEPSLVIAALLVGGVSYGLSLVLFVHALRYLGAARTSAYFGAGPFLATLLSLLIEGSWPTSSLLAATVLMVLGTVLMVVEQHEHEHEHDDGVTHTHWHFPDMEHRHRH